MLLFCIKAGVLLVVAAMATESLSSDTALELENEIDAGVRFGQTRDNA